MKPKLKLKLNNYIIRNLLTKFQAGKPLEADQLNFLARHEKTLSHRSIDPALAYYLKHYHHDYLDDHSFLLPSDRFNKANLSKLKKRLQILLAKERSHVVFQFSHKQFEQFKKINFQELVLTHGNQLLSGAPFHPGGIPHVLFFQWGNLFGVAKYVVHPDEKAQKSNFLIYFEDRQDRDLDTCVKEYIKEHQAKPAPKPEATHQYYRTPTLSLKIHKDNESDEKK